MFKSTQQRLYKIVGSTKLSDLAPEWQTSVSRFLDAEEKADPKFKNAEIRCFLTTLKSIGDKLIGDYRGSQPHLSHDDPSDKEDVISIRLKDGDNKTLQRAHVHVDGSTNKIQSGYR
ncbi:hypothetical protein N7449_005080 [Penicillium cf. viridicatum]|uniref:Uncharacterized protein n=1 Tax=Penicillium cf. viridicatum TaxID=2972119 RepID=A0A9W9SYX4_9EURO|nr:hypothetical protein N7449_005080 [Penicillium cf. viridicatum]